MIVIVDYGMGNLKSVAKAVEIVGARCKVSNRAKDIIRADKLILPGVGAFKEAMAHIRSLGLFNAICDFLNSQKPFFGICLGMQLLFNNSYEGGFSKGFRKVSGSVKRFRLSNLKVPHMGWNSIELTKNRCPLFKSIPSGSFMYFAHSYYVKPLDGAIVAANTYYGVKFASALWRQNLFLTQFHPEKSQRVGLKIIKNFVKL